MSNPAVHKHYPALDGIRGVAVLTVMLLHFTLFVPSNAFESVYSAVLNAGWVGVDLFFVLSGFLITGILIDSRDNPHHFRNFYVRRTLRIFPLYYAYLILLFLVLPAISGSYAAEHAEWDRRGWFWLYLGNFLMASHGWEGMPGHTTHLWSLAIEEQFYLIWPLVLYFVPARRRVMLCVLTMLSAWFVRDVLVAQGAAAAGYVFTLARTDTLAAGALIAVLLRDYGDSGLRDTSRRMLYFGLILIAATLSWNLFQGELNFIPALDPQTQLVGYSGIALTFAAIIGLTVTNSNGTLSRLFNRSSLRTLGKYSYALYLIHVPIRNVFKSLIERYGALPEVAGSQLPAQIVVYAVGIAASLALSWLSWNLFEKHFLNLKDKLAPPTKMLAIKADALAPTQPSVLRAKPPTRP